MLLQVTDITVKKYRIICRVQVFEKKYSDLSLKEKLIKKVPSLQYHKCKNLVSSNFIDVLENTSLPHVLEHLIIDIQSKNSNKIFIGSTEWLNEEQGIAKIELSYDDDLVCFNAIREAQDLMNS